MTTRADPQVVLPLRRHGDSAPLFCIHPGSGFGLPYAAIVPHVRQDVPVIALQARGLLSPTNRPMSIDEMVDDYLTQIRAVQPGGPYRLLGWCIGGRAAFEIACRLRDAGEGVGLLGIISALPPAGGRHLDAEEILRDMLRPPGAEEMDAELAALCRLPLDHAALREHLRRTGHPMRRLSERTMEAVYQNYRTSDRLGRAPIKRAFDGDMLVVAPRAEGPSPLSADSWRPHVTGEIHFHRVTCRHGQMMEPGPARAIGTLVNDVLGH